MLLEERMECYTIRSIYEGLVMRHHITTGNRQRGRAGHFSVKNADRIYKTRVRKYM